MTALDRLTQLDARLTELDSNRWQRGKLTAKEEREGKQGKGKTAALIAAGALGVLGVGGALGGALASRKYRKPVAPATAKTFSSLERLAQLDAKIGTTEFNSRRGYPEEKPSLLGRVAKVGALGIGAYGLGSFARGAFSAGAFPRSFKAAGGAFMAGHRANMGNAQSALDRVRDMYSKKRQGVPPVL